jgi:hypothetical protein
MAQGKHAVPKQETSRKRRWAAVVAWTMAIVVAPVGFAVAANGWQSVGKGNGTAKATTAVDLQVTAGSASSQLYPGASGDVKFSVTNPNTYPVSITGWSGATITGTDKAGCATTDFTLNAGTISSPVVAAGATANVTVAGGITMATGAPNECQGVGVTVNATLNAASA